MISSFHVSLSTTSTAVSTLRYALLWTDRIRILLRDVYLALFRLTLTHLQRCQAFFLLWSSIDLESVSAKGVDRKFGSNGLLLVHPDELHLAN